MKILSGEEFILKYAKSKARHHKVKITKFWFSERTDAAIGALSILVLLLIFTVYGLYF